jgi:hypothetical protein
MTPRRVRKPTTATKPTPKKPSLDRKPRGGKSSPNQEVAETPARDPRATGTRGEDEILFHEARDYLRAGEVTGGRAASVEERLAGEQRRAVEWARAQGRLIADEAVESVRLLSNSTSEHEVRYNVGDERVLKRTWPGFYGQIPEWRNGRLERRNALPSEYLERMALQIEVFESGFPLEGVNVPDKPSMILGQPQGQPSFVVCSPSSTPPHRAALRPLPLRSLRSSRRTSSSPWPALTSAGCDGAMPSRWSMRGPTISSSRPSA